MKTFKTRLIVVLWGMLIPLLAANCIFSGRGGRGRGNGQGQRHTKTGALDVSYENDKDLKLSGRVTWTHNNTNNKTHSNTNKETNE